LIFWSKSKKVVMRVGRVLKGRDLIALKKNDNLRREERTGKLEGERGEGRLYFSLQHTFGNERERDGKGSGKPIWIQKKNPDLSHLGKGIG